MRIALVTTEYVTEPSGDGGLAGYLHRVAVTLRDMGHVPVVLVAADSRGYSMHQGVEVHRVAVRHPLLQGLDWVTRHRLPLNWLWQSYQLNRYLHRLETRQAFDVIQYSSYMATALFRRSPTPAVVRLSSLQSMLHEANDVPRRLRERLAERLEMSALRRADLLFAPSRWLADVAQSLTGRSVHVLASPWLPPHEVADPSLYEQHLAGKRYLLYFGTLNTLKGIPTLAAVLPDVLASYPELHVVAIGKEQAYRGRPMSRFLRESAGRHANRVHYFDRQPRTRLGPVVEHALAVILPSRIDNLPNACIEAMSYAKTVVATKGSSFDELIDDGVNGLLFRVDDPDDLRATLFRLLQLPASQLEAMGRRARAGVGRLHADKVIGELVEFYGLARQSAGDVRC